MKTMDNKHGPQMERKVVTEFREIDDRIVTGFPSIFGNVDDGGDLIRAGAYRKTIQERRGRMRWLWQHDNTLPPIATILDIAEVGREDLLPEILDQFPEAIGGLRVKREYLDTPRGNEVLVGIKSGAVNEMSIGYDPVKIEPHEPMEINGRPVYRILSEIRLWDLSDVNWGMNAATANLKLLNLDDATAEEIEARLHEFGRWNDIEERVREQMARGDADAALAADAIRRAGEQRRRRLALLATELGCGR